MCALSDSSGGSGDERPLTAIDQGRAWIAQALVRLGHHELIDRHIDPEVPRPNPASRLRAIVKRLRFQRDSLKYQLKAVGTLTVIYLIVSVALGVDAAAGHLHPLGVVFAVLALPLLAGIDDLEGAVFTLAIAVVIAWITVLIILLVHHPARVLYAYVAPALVVSVLVWILPTQFPLRDEYDVALVLRGAVRSAPLLGAVLLGLLALALLNADLWRAADALDSARIAGVAALTIGPLVLVFRARLRRQLGDVMRECTKRLNGSPNERSRQLRHEIRLAAPDADHEAIERCADAVACDHWPLNSVKEYLPELEQSERKVLLAPVTIRLLLTVLLVGLIVLTYVYLLAWVAVPVHVASDWIKHAPPLTHLHVGVRVAVPRGAYFRVSGLLSLIATAAFLGSAALDKRVARPLTDAILGEPVTRFLILALPYSAMVGKAPTPRVSST